MKISPQLMRDCGLSQKTAFTLLELLLVISLLGITAAWSLPSLSRVYDIFQVNQTTQELVSLMRYARLRAVIHGESITLFWDPHDRRFWFKSDQKLTGPAGRGLKIPRPIEVHADFDIIHFLPDGRMDKFRISLCGKNQCRTISTRENRGYLRISAHEAVRPTPRE